MFTKTHIKKSLRFRRWSRKQYAVFYSIGQHVTIGNLKSIIADTFLGKQKTFRVTCNDAANFLIADEDNDSVEPPPTGQQGLLTLLFCVLAKPAQYKKEKKNSLSIAYIMADSNNCCRPFLFNPKH